MSPKGTGKARRPAGFLFPNHAVCRTVASDLRRGIDMNSRLIPIIALGLGFSTAVAMAQSDAGEQTEPAATVEVADSEPDRAAKAEARAKANSWWNVDTVVQAVKLSDEQRQQMDELLGKDKEARDAGGTKRQDVEKQLEAAFLAGDLDAARKYTSELQKQSADGRGENALKFEVLGLLNEDQMEVLKAQYARVLSDSWRRNTTRLVEADKERGKNRNEQGDRDAKREQREAKRAERQQQQTEQGAAEPAANDD